MQPLNLEKFWEDLLAYFMSNPQANMSSVAVNQAVVDAGYNPADLAGLDHAKIYEAACGRPGVLAEYRNTAPPAPTQEAVVRHITQVSEVHNHNTQIIDQSENVDNSVHVGDVDTGGGDFDFDQDNVTATGGSVAGGRDAVGATGEGAAASGSGDAAASGGVNLDQSNNLDIDLGGFGRGLSERSDLLGGQPLSEFSRVADTGGGGLFPARPDNFINTGGGDQTIIGDGASIEDSQVGHFGDGAQNIGGTVENSQVSNAGNATNFENNDLDDGSALGISAGDITGSNDESQHASTHGDFSPIAQEEGPGDQDDRDDINDPSFVPN